MEAIMTAQTALLKPSEVFTHAQVLRMLLLNAHHYMSGHPRGASEVDAGLLLEEIRSTVLRTLGLPEYERSAVSGIMPSEMLVMLEDCIERVTCAAESAFYAVCGADMSGEPSAERIFESVAATAHALLCTPRFETRRLLEIAQVFRPTAEEVASGFSDPHVPMQD
jgi:hypothetical protein